MSIICFILSISSLVFSDVFLDHIKMLLEITTIPIRLWALTVGVVVTGLMAYIFPTEVLQFTMEEPQLISSLSANDGETTLALTNYYQQGSNAANV